MSSSVRLDESITAETDLYSLLGVKSDSSESVIRKAYRKVALKYHPDKNPSEDAKAKFHSLSIALDTLVTEELRESYDSLRRSHVEQQRRRDELNAHRRHLQTELETREREAVQSRAQDLDRKRKLELLKMEGLKKRKLHEDKMMMRGQSDGDSDVGSPESRTVKLKLRKSAGLASNELKSALDQIMSRFGKVEKVIVTTKKDRYGASVVYAQAAGAALASEQNYEDLRKESPLYGFVSSASLVGSASTLSTDDYAKQTLARLRAIGRRSVEQTAT